MKFQVLQSGFLYQIECSSKHFTDLYCSSFIRSMRVKGIYFAAYCSRLGLLRCANFNTFCIEKGTISSTLLFPHYIIDVKFPVCLQPKKVEQFSEHFTLKNTCNFQQIFQFHITIKACSFQYVFNVYEKGAISNTFYIEISL